MNIDTGEIKQFQSEEAADQYIRDSFGRWIKIDVDDMTEKQKRTLVVSPHDTRSKLAKMRREVTNGNKRRKSRRSTRGKK